MPTTSQRFALLGIRLPLRGDMHNGRLIVDADGHAVAMVLPCHSATLERDRVAAFLKLLNEQADDDAAGREAA